MKKIFVILCFAFSFLVSKGQNPVSSIDVTPSYPSASSEQLSAMDAETRAHVTTDIAVEVNLSSTTDIGKVAVKVGLTEGGSDLFYKEFDFGNPGTFGDGTSYSRNGNTLTIGVGSFSGYGTYYTEVCAIRANGSAESPVRDVIN